MLSRHSSCCSCTEHLVTQDSSSWEGLVLCGLNKSEGQVQSIMYSSRITIASYTHSHKHIHNNMWKKLDTSHFCFTLMSLPSQPVTSSVKLGLWSVLHDKFLEHPITLPLSLVLILRHTSLEIRPVEFVSTASTLTLSEGFVGIEVL